MVPVGKQAKPLPLLPWEKQLIAALGCSEDDYHQFIRELHRRAVVRPAAYELVPDVRNDPLTTSILVSLAVGVLSTAASYLLAPKPSQPSAPDQQRVRRQENITGPQSFAPTFGFSSQQKLAEYGTPVPIVFAKQQLVTDDLGETYYAGGVLISPLLVWSRIKSFGSHQVIELLMVAGQAPMERPDVAGIFIGNNTLDSMHDESYQYYYTGGFDEDTSSRLQGRNLRYGKLAQPVLPGATEDAFYCPTRLGGGRPGFSHTYTPTSNTKFGVYGAIPNGTPYRLNWEIISVTELEGKTRDAAREEAAKQYRIVAQSDMDSVLGGEDLFRPYNSGMPGVGRNYARHVGVVEHNGYMVPSPDNEQLTGTRIRTVNKGDTIRIVVGYGRQARKPTWSQENPTRGTNVNTEDVRSATDNENVTYDTRFKLGTYFLIGRALFRVIDRSAHVYEPGITGHVDVRLECIETWSPQNNKIGIVGINKIENSDFLVGPDISEAFFPICQVEFANVINNKDCDVTELGIKSNVWLRFDGICNFNALPQPDALINKNKRKIQLTTSYRNSYGTRTSFFRLYVRPANETADGSAKWVFIKTFCVKGSSPVDQYNFIRIFHPKRDRYEFRIRPVTSGEDVYTGTATDPNWQIDATASYSETVVTTDYGEFKIGAKFRTIINNSTWGLNEMIDRPSEVGTSTTVTIGGNSNVPRSISYQGLVENGTNNSVTNFKESNVWSKKAGTNPFYDNLGNDATHEFDIIYTDEGQGIGGNREITMKIKLKSYYEERVGAKDNRNLWWKVQSVTVVAASGNWRDEDVFRKARFYDDLNNEFQAVFRVDGLSEDRIAVQTTIGRKFEEYPGIAEVSHYGDLIKRSCDDGPEHEIVYINESLEEKLIPQFQNLAMTGLKFKSGFNITNVDQMHLYMKNGVNVELLTDGGVGPSNLFTDLAYYLLTNSDIGVGGIISQELIDRDQLAATGRYLRANGLWFDEVITQGINVRSYLASKAPSMLCNLTTKNGIFSIEPALPINGNDVIDGTIRVPIKAIFTDGNIIEGSFSLDYLGLEERKMFQAVVRYRKERQNKFPEERTVSVRYKGDEDKPIEEFDFSHITSTSHAIKVAKYFLSLRKYVTHSVTFKTTPDGNALQPGDWIKVATAASPYNPVANGIVKADGTVVSTEPLTAGSYSVFYWNRASDTISEGAMVIAADGTSNLRNIIFSIKSGSESNYLNVYQIEALDIDQDGIVGVKATEFPVDSQGRSIIAQDVTPRSGQFDVIADVLD